MSFRSGCLAAVLAGSGCFLPGIGFSSNTVIFSPALLPRLAQEIQQARETVEIEVYKFSEQSLIGELQAARRRGVQIRVILCPSEPGNRRPARRLRALGIQVRWYPLRKREQIMHLKLALFDRRRLWFGSANWTHWGMTLHHEGAVLSEDPQMVRESVWQYEQDWNQSEPEP